MIRRRIGNNNDKPQESSQHWALSYGDMMTLLLCFFVLIVSYSTVELIKFRQAMGSLKGALGVIQNYDGPTAWQQDYPMMKRPVLRKENVLEILSEVEAQVFQLSSGDNIEIEVMEGGVNFRINEEMLFDIGGAELKPSVMQVLEKIGRIINRFSCEVRVEGHTDNLPIRTDRFPSNWELSSVRAVSVVRYFVEKLKVQPSRCTAVGCGEHRPLFSNDTYENRRKNRRVEILLSWGDINNIMGI